MHDLELISTTLLTKSIKIDCFENLKEFDYLISKSLKRSQARSGTSLGFRLHCGFVLETEFLSCKTCNAIYSQHFVTQSKETNASCDEQERYNKKL